LAPKKKTFCPSFSFLFPPRKREKRSFQKLLSFVLSFFSWGAIISLLSSSSSREGKTSLRWKSTPPSRDDGNSSQATEDVSLLKSRFFFYAEERRQVERAFDHFQKHTPADKTKMD
jgi:hypothetical protein